MVLCNIPHARAQNATIIVDGFIIQSVYGNGTGELVKRDGDTIPGTIGGPPSDGNPENNTVTIRNGVVDDGVYGSWAASGIVINNKVTVTGNSPGSTVNNVYGGYVGVGLAINNEVTIENNSRVTGRVVGGYANALTTDTTFGTTSNNTVTIRSGAIVTGDVYGGRSGSAISNIVNIEGGNISGRIVGGGNDDKDSLSAYYNEVNVSAGSIINGDIYGGLINISDALENTVNITGGLLTGNVYGGVTGLGNSGGNIVSIAGAVVNGGNEIIGGRSNQGAAIGNEVYIINSQFLNNNGVITGGSTSVGDADANIVNIDGGEVNIQGVTGGISSIGNSNGNNVIIGENGGKFSISTLTGGSSSSGSASNNSVSVYRGTFNNIFGGMTSGNGNASGNAITLYGGTFNGNIIGGYSSTGAATGNLVDIHQGVIMGNNTRVYGGSSASGIDSRSGNTLNIRGPIKISGLNNFENYNFYLPADLTANQTMITVTSGSGNSSSSDRSINLKDAKVEIGVSDGSTLKNGDTVILIDEQGGFGFNGAPANNVSDGSTLDAADRNGLIHYRFGLTATDNQLLASVTNASLDSRTDSIPEGFLGGLILANQGADAIAGAAMDSAMTAAHKGPIEGLGGFGSLIVGKSKYDTGSDIDMTGVSAAAGLAIGVDFSKSSLTMGPFFEYGKADFDTVDNLADGRKVTGDGDSEYMGGGFLLRMDYKDVGLGRYFAEASVRAGRQKNNFSINWPGNDEETFSYNSSAPYYGIHLGYGGSWDVASSAALDVYGKYFFARGGNSNVSMSNGEDVDFDAVTSNRIRGGARMAYLPNNNITVSFGGAYEYEMSGEISAFMLSHAINAPSLKGGTGIGEVVFGFKPGVSPTTINIGIQGHTGKRKGLSASLYVRF